MSTLNLQNTRNPLFDRQKHPFHLLGPSPYPLLVSTFLFFLLLSTTFYLHGMEIVGFSRPLLTHCSFIGLFCVVLRWFVSILSESRQGYHTRKVQAGLRLGMILFIISEVMLFVAFFWAFFHLSLSPSTAVGAVWPPFGTQVLNVWGLPLANTILLLTSGVTITISHAYILRNNHDGFFWYLFLTVVLGVVFLLCQGFEYKYGIKFSWRDSIYGSIFFITTGFHGMHVVIGTLFLSFCWFRHLITTMLPLMRNQSGCKQVVNFLATNFGYDVAECKYWGMTAKYHFGFEAAAWYWHFVDVVWLFLFISIYWWGGS